MNTFADQVYVDRPPLTWHTLGAHAALRAEIAPIMRQASGSTLKVFLAASPRQ